MRARLLLLSLVSSLVVSCGGPARIAARSDARALLGDDWFAARAERLSITADEARARDRAIGEATPPELDSLDPFVREQAAALWTELCAKCHGEDGDPASAAEKSEPPPRAWGGVGASMGFFFGGDEMRAGIYRRIADGGAPREDGSASAMPAWSESLAREQIWALVYHIESF